MMRASLLWAKGVNEETGKACVIYAVDQQLYRVGLLIKLHEPEEFQQIYLRLGRHASANEFCGMHGIIDGKLRSI
jgi:hypothetical protein